MLKVISPLFIIYFILIVASCTTTSTIAALKPEPDDAIPLLYENTPSFLNIPISIKLNDIEAQTNVLLNGLIYEDNTIADDAIEMKVWKIAPIEIKNEGNGKDDRMRIVLPLKATIKYRIGTKKMGVEMYTVREFHLNGVITLVSDVELTNWKLKTKTEIKSLEWHESPTMTVFGKNVPVTYLINPSIHLFKSKIEREIDKAIANAMDYKPNVLAALEKICLPTKMSSTYESWLRIIPIELYSTNVKLKNDTFIVGMGMKCLMETLIGKQPESKFNASKIILKTVTKIPQELTANIIAISTYQEASKIMTKNFVGQEFTSGSKKAKVQNVAMWHKNGKMILALDLLGSVNGTIYLSGFPKYNDQTKEVYFDQLSYALDTKNKLIQTANWLAQSIILKKIEQSCRYSIKPNLEEGQKSMMTYLNNYSPMLGVFVNGKIQEISFQKIELTNQAIMAFIKVQGIINVSVNGLK